MTRRRVTTWLGLAATALVLAGCGSNAPSPSATPSATPQPTASALPVPDVQPDDRWPDIANDSGGAFDDAQAQALGTAMMRTQVLAGWANEHVQLIPLAHMMAASFLLGDSGVALAEGDAVHTPDCDIYPTELSVRAPNTTLVLAFKQRNLPVRDGDLPVVISFDGPCTLTATTPSGETRTLETEPASRIVVLVHPVDDPVVGRVAFLDVGTSCTDPAVAGVC
jgi:hypothetical protein